MSQPPRARPRRHAIIVGAGVAGLAAAQQLLASQHDIQVTVLEARNRVGGRILTTWLNTVEHDPDQPLQQAPHDRPPDPAAPDPSTAPTADLHSAADVRDWAPNTKSPNPALAHPSSSKETPHALPFAALVNGTFNPPRETTDAAPLTAVDIGASIMHGCGDDSQHVFHRAIQEKIRAPVVAGGGFYESTEHALWFDQNTGKRIPSEKVVEVHNIFFMASRYMAAVSAVSDDGAADLQSVFDCGVEYVCDQLGERKLTDVEHAIMKKICARSVGYCSSMDRMALMQASAGMDASCSDIQIGSQFDEDDPPYPGELPAMSANGIRQQAARLTKAVINTQKPPKPMIANKRGGSGDRIVLDGYTPFLIDKLAHGVDIRLGQAVCGVAKVHKAVVDEGTSEIGEAQGFSGTKSNDPHATSQGVSDVHSRSIIVSTRTGDVYPGDFVIMTVPLGVLRGEHAESSVQFSPPLSYDKVEAIGGMAMGVHNKVVLRFRKQDVFWPPKIPQLNCLDPRFQFFNLHSYGKTGVLLVQVFAQSGFAKGFSGLSDAGVVAEVLTVLGGMFCKRERSNDTSVDDAAAQAANKTSKERRRVAQLLNICEKVDCGAAVTKDTSQGRNGGGVQCSSCGLVMDWGPQAEQDQKAPSKRPEHSARLRQKAAKMHDHMDQRGDEKDLEEIELGPQQRSLTWSKFPAPEEYIVTRWDEDPYALGSYSFMPCGSNWQMIDQIATPEPPDDPHPYLFFAGEHCSDLGWQCVHGAYETGLKSARRLLACIESVDGAPPVRDEGLRNAEIANAEPAVSVVTQPTVTPRALAKRRKSQLPPNSSPNAFWTDERERALTRALIGYSDVYGNFMDLVDEMAFALFNFKKEPTSLTQEQVLELVHERIEERARDNDKEAKAFLHFHSPEVVAGREGAFPKRFQELTKRQRMVGLNGSILKDRYADEIVRELRLHAEQVSNNEVSYRETLRKIAMKLYMKDGGLMTKRCLSEYLRTQEFGTGPQKELYMAKYLPVLKR